MHILSIQEMRRQINSSKALTNQQKCHTMSYKRNVMLYIKYSLFWSQKTIDKVLAKHNITPEEVDEVIFSSKFICHSYGKGADKREYVYGQTLAGKYIFIVLAKHLRGGGKYRVITAREMNERERKYYRKHQFGK